MDCDIITKIKHVPYFLGKNWKKIEYVLTDFSEMEEKVINCVELLEDHVVEP